MLIWTMPLLQKGLKMNQTIYEKEKKKEPTNRHQMCLMDLFQKLQ
jgi:hypothetical protein